MTIGRRISLLPGYRWTSNTPSSTDSISSSAMTREKNHGEENDKLSGQPMVNAKHKSIKYVAFVYNCAKSSRANIFANLWCVDKSLVPLLIALLHWIVWDLPHSMCSHCSREDKNPLQKNGSVDMHDMCYKYNSERLAEFLVLEGKKAYFTHLRIVRAYLSMLVYFTVLN